ncbi:MAG: hypothetical protein ABFR50_10060 [Candidatus Fermentibacteria bacterium]
MEYRENKNIYISVISLLTLSMLFLAGCFLFPSSGFHNNLRINGYVLSSTDSSAVPGANIIVFDSGLSNVRDIEYSDSTGYFECCWTPLTEGDIGPFRYWDVRVIDVDGSENGIFADLDSTIVEEDPLHNNETVWDLTLYVELL